MPDMVRTVSMGILIMCAAAFGPWETSLAAGTEDRLTLAEAGQARVAIVIPESKDKAGRLAASAAKVLTAHLRQISGATFPILTEKELGATSVQDGKIVPQAETGKLAPEIAGFILVGQSELTRRLGVTAEGLGRGSIEIRTMGKGMVIFGTTDDSNDRGGTTYAVYQFLERLGCRWLWPGELGKVMPKQPSLSVGPMDIRYAPPLGQRKIRFASEEKMRGFEEGLKKMGLDGMQYQKARAKAVTTQAGGEWGAWQGLGGDLGLTGGHNGAGLGHDGWEKYGKSHPEWFALQGGGSRDQSGAKDRWRLCVSNPELIDCVAGKIIEELRRRPVRCVSLSPNDGGYSGFCLCENCKKLDPPEAPKVMLKVFRKAGESRRKKREYPSLSDRYVWYWNQVAERVTKEFPEQLFLVDAYSVYSTPPVREKLHTSLVVRYVPSDTKGWTGWQQAGAKRIYWRPNTLYFGANEGTLSRFSAREIAERMGYLIDHAMIGTDMDSCLDNWATMGFSYYVAARMNWNPRLKYEEILDDYCRAGFGPASAAVRRYFLTVEALRDATAEELGAKTLEKYTPAAIEELRGLLAQAGREVSGNTEDNAEVRARIDFLRQGLEFTAVTAEAMRLRNAAEAKQPVDAKEVARVMERRWRMMREMALKQPLAVNVPYVAANSEYLWRPLGWKEPE